MAQVQPVTTLNGGITEKNGNELTIEESGIAHIQNGVLLHGTPTKDLNGASTSLETAEELQLSPGDLRRRSTRASALKAQEKIKLKDDIVQGPQKRLGEEEESVAEDGTVPKKRRLETGDGFDQTCFRFGLRANDEGEVYAMTDESENSSIHDSEMEIVRYHYEKMLNREPDEETIRQRLKMRKDAENALREEEAKLAVLRKMKDSQGRAINKLAAETKAADLAEAAAANAYKPVLANPSKGGVANNGKAATALANKQVLAGLANLTQTQQLDLLQKLSVSSQAAKHAYQLAKKNPAQTTQVFAQLIALNNAHQMMQKQKESESSDRGQQQQQQSQAQITQTKVASHQQTPAQRAAAARLAFRAQADKQLMTIPTHKVQPHDITFLPNPNASAFLALHGLDQVVQHVLKDRSHEKPYSGPSYECEECKTDCAPTWKAIGSNPKELHLYCESCVRSAQKRKNRADQTNLLKRAFQKISAQEKEFEKKIADGSLEAFVETTVSKPTSSVQVATSSTATVVSTPLPPHRLSNLPSSSGTSTPTLAHKTSTPLSSTPKTSSSASKKTLQQQQQQMLAMQQMMSQSLRNNPAAMAQMMQMYQMAQAAQAAQVQQAVAQGGMNSAALNLLMQSMAQQQAAHAISAQAQAQQQQQQARAAQAKKEAAAAAAAQQQQQQQQQHNQAMMMALLAQTKQMTPQMIQNLSNLTPAQQKAFYDMLQKAVKK